MNVSLRPNCKKRLDDVLLDGRNNCRWAQAGGMQSLSWPVHDIFLQFARVLVTTKSIIFIYKDFIDFATVTFLATFLSDPRPPPIPAYKRFCPKLIIGLLIKCVTDHYWLLCCCGPYIKIEPWPRPQRWFLATESLSQIFISKILISEIVYENWRALAVIREINATSWRFCTLKNSAEPSLRRYL